MAQYVKSAIKPGEVIKKEVKSTKRVLLADLLEFGINVVLCIVGVVLANFIDIMLAFACVFGLLAVVELKWLVPDLLRQSIISKNHAYICTDEVLYIGAFGATIFSAKTEIIDIDSIISIEPKKSKFLFIDESAMFHYGKIVINYMSNGTEYKITTLEIDNYLDECAELKQITKK